MGRTDKGKAERGEAFQKIYLSPASMETGESTGTCAGGRIFGGICHTVEKKIGTNIFVLGY